MGTGRYSATGKTGAPVDRRCRGTRLPFLLIHDASRCGHPRPSSYRPIRPAFLSGTAAPTFGEFRHLDGLVTYGVDEEDVWARTPDFSAKAGWRHVAMWRERSDWLILQGNGFRRLPN
jgi:hypothetical protein